MHLLHFNVLVQVCHHERFLFETNRFRLVFAMLEFYIIFGFYLKLAIFWFLFETSHFRPVIRFIFETSRCRLGFGISEF